MEHKNQLFKLLNVDSIEEQSVSDAIVAEVKQNPHYAASRYHYTTKLFFSTKNAFPLHQALMLGANIHVIQAIYNSHPPAIEHYLEGRNDEEADNTALQIAIKYAPTDVVLFLLKRWPEASRKVDWSGCTTLHLACKYNSSIELVDALLGYYPDATKKKSRRGHTPLHIACCSNAPSKVILMLIETWPQATREGCEDDLTPYYYYSPSGELDEIENVLICVPEICDSSKERVALSNVSMDFFEEMEWWGGVLLLLDHQPSVVKYLDININVLADLLLVIGSRCKLTTMWYVISNNLDIFDDNI